MVSPLFERELECAPGPFYVVKGLCITCSLPIETAPGNVAYHDQHCAGCPNECSDHCFIGVQPQSREEIEAMIDVIAGSCVQAYRYCGTDPDILARLVARGCADRCDALAKNPLA